MNDEKPKPQRQFFVNCPLPSPPPLGEGEGEAADTIHPSPQQGEVGRGANGRGFVSNLVKT
jgi:hypothetical protein